MSTFLIVIGSSAVLAVIVFSAFKIHEKERKDENKSKDLEVDIENLGEDINKEIRDLEKEIEEFEL